MDELPNKQTVNDLRTIINEGLDKMGIHTAYDFSPLLQDLVIYITEHDQKLVQQVRGVGEAGQVSDGYHTFNELYDHRIALFIALMKSHPEISWRANNHADGSSYEGWFIAGMHLPTGDISYHLPDDKWTLLDGVGIATTNRAPEWDGHTPADVVRRLNEWSAMHTKAAISRNVAR
jgi:hypothetical protein